MKVPHNEKGITLVEVLAVTVLTGVIVTLIIGVHLYSQKQFDHQRNDALHLTDITLIAHEITKEIRTADIAHIDSTLIEFMDSNKYELKGDVIYKNDSPYIYDIAKFELNKVADEVSLLIESSSGQKIETSLVVRVTSKDL